MMTATFDKAGNLVVTIQHNDLKNLPVSASGKSRIVATSGGNQPMAGLNIDGQVVKIGLNAYVSK